MPLVPGIDWPEELGCAQRATYRGTGEPRLAAIEVQDGPPRLRLASSEQKRSYVMSFVFTARQMQLFEFFYHDTLDAGAQWFNMPVLTGLGLLPHVCHFTGTRTVEPHRDLLNHYVVTTEVEAYAAAYPVPPPFVMSDPVDAGTPGAPSFDGYDARAGNDPLPTDIINALVPGV